MGQFIDELNISQSELFDNAGLGQYVFLFNTLIAALDKIPIKVFFRRHDRTGRGRSSDGTWSRKEQRMARTELSKVKYWIESIIYDTLYEMKMTAFSTEK